MIATSSGSAIDCAAVEFSVNRDGAAVLLRPRPPKGVRQAHKDRFDAVRGRADAHLRIDELMELLRADD